MKSEIYEFDPVIYPFPLLVSKVFDTDELKERFYIVLSKTEVGEASTEFNGSPTTIATTIQVVEKATNQMYYLVLLRQPKKIGCGVVTHEAVHVNTLNAEWLGIGEPTPNTDEPHAYFTQWAANCIYSVLKNKPETMKGERFE